MPSTFTKTLQSRDTVKVVGRANTEDGDGARVTFRGVVTDVTDREFQFRLTHGTAGNSADTIVVDGVKNTVRREAEGAEIDLLFWERTGTH